MLIGQEDIQIGYTPTTLFLKVPTKIPDDLILCIRTVSIRVRETLDSLPAGAFHNPNIPKLVDDVEALENLLGEKHAHLIEILDDQTDEDKALKKVEATINDERMAVVAREWGKKTESANAA